MKNLKLICMGFDGEFQTERPTFQSVEEAWEYASDLGSKWYFYPFHFVVSNSLKTIVAAPDGVPELIGRRLQTIVTLFADVAFSHKDEKLDCYQWLNLVMQRFDERA
jgi:hypothetical protein